MVSTSDRSHVRLLVVVDGYFSLGSQDRNDRSFSISHLIKTLKSSTKPRVYVDTAHRDGDLDASIWGKFNFATSVPDLSVYDQIWLFGYNGPNNADPNNSAIRRPIEEQELLSIARFMQDGGGVLASGDHEGLGCFMCGFIPRVRTMRKWFSESDENKYYGNRIPQIVPRNWPVSGPQRADTLVKDLEGEFKFTNQSDDKPQKLQLVPLPEGGLHYIFHLGGPGDTRALEEFPDHFHEGEVLGFGGVEASVPWSVDETLSFCGQSFVEYPQTENAGHKELPRVVAMGHVQGGHQTLVEGSKLCESGFEPDQSETVDKKINTLSVYDGHKVGIGRVLTDSSFHHFVDLNMIGDPCATAEKTRGFGLAFLNDMEIFIENCVRWLARSPSSGA